MLHAHILARRRWPGRILHHLDRGLTVATLLIRGCVQVHYLRWKEIDSCSNIQKFCKYAADKHFFAVRRTNSKGKREPF